MSDSFAKYSAICTAFVAAPFLKLSLTTHIFSELACDSSLLILPTKTSSLPFANIGIGYMFTSGLSCKVTPSVLFRSFLTTERSKSFLNSTFIDSLCPPAVGILTAVAVIRIPSSPSIF